VPRQAWAGLPPGRSRRPGARSGQPTAPLGLSASSGRVPAAACLPGQPGTARVGSRHVPSRESGRGFNPSSSSRDFFPYRNIIIRQGFCSTPPDGSLGATPWVPASGYQSPFAGLWVPVPWYRSLGASPWVPVHGYLSQGTSPGVKAPGYQSLGASPWVPAFVCQLSREPNRALRDQHQAPSRRPPSHRRGGSSSSLSLQHISSARRQRAPGNPG